MATNKKVNAPKSAPSKKVVTFNPTIANPIFGALGPQLTAWALVNGGMQNCKLVPTKYGLQFIGNAPLQGGKNPPKYTGHNNAHGQCPLPYTNMQKRNNLGHLGKRAVICWALVNGHVPTGTIKGQQPTAYCLNAMFNLANSLGATPKHMADIMALVNGGYSSSSKYWGTPFYTIVTK